MNICNKQTTAFTKRFYKLTRPLYIVVLFNVHQLGLQCMLLYVWCQTFSKSFAWFSGLVWQDPAFARSRFALKSSTCEQVQFGAFCKIVVVDCVLKTSQPEYQAFHFGFGAQKDRGSGFLVLATREMEREPKNERARRQLQVQLQRIMTYVETMKGETVRHSNP